MMSQRGWRSVGSIARRLVAAAAGSSSSCSGDAGGLCLGPRAASDAILHHEGLSPLSLPPLDSPNAPSIAKAASACHCKPPERRGTYPGRCLIPPAGFTHLLESTRRTGSGSVSQECWTAHPGRRDRSRRSHHQRNRTGSRRRTASTSRSGAATTPRAGAGSG
jgi:hypothetical protein